MPKCTNCGMVFSPKYSPMKYVDKIERGSSWGGPRPVSNVRHYYSECPTCKTENYVGRKNLDDPSTPTVWNMGGTMVRGKKRKGIWTYKNMQNADTKPIDF